MCTPQAYIASRILQGFTQYQSDKAQANRINADTTAKAERLRDEAIYTDNSLIRQKEIEEDKTIDQKLAIKEQELKTSGTAKTQFFENGIGGNLYNTVIGDIARQAGKQINTVDMNYENKLRAIASDRLAYNRRYTDQILSLPRAYKPSFMTYALSATMDIGSMYMSNQAPSTPSASSGQTFNLTYENYNSPR
jgi:hypothetical protein